MTQVRSACGMCRSRWITGNATLTTEPSSVFMSIAMQTTPRAIQRRRSPARVGTAALIPGTQRTLSSRASGAVARRGVLMIRLADDEHVAVRVGDDTGGRPAQQETRNSVPSAVPDDDELEASALGLVHDRLGRVADSLDLWPPRRRPP